jgi:hypothetical protein
MSLFLNYKYPYYSLLHNKNTSPQINHCIYSQKNCNSESGNTRHFFRKEGKTKQTGWCERVCKLVSPTELPTSVNKQVFSLVAAWVWAKPTFLKFTWPISSQIQSWTTRWRWLPFRVCAMQLTKASNVRQIHTIWNGKTTGRAKLSQPWHWLKINGHQDNHTALSPWKIASIHWTGG